MSLPKRVVVGPYTYRLRTDRRARARAEREAGQSLFGYTNNATLEIIINPECAEPVVADTLLHELLHAVFNQTGLSEFTGEMEEQIVASLSTGLMDALRRNPKLTAAILGGAR